ncbi:hypothetical protein BDZ97DRAFT_1840862 [Flammula alnicola]|nr:hypothetical protein BDZ97DRAFT_1840862 [Flammula alnicola]
MRPLPNPQNIHVVLNPKSGGDVYLDIPYTDIRRLSLSPSRLLHYFCFVVLGLKGTVHADDDQVVALEGEEGRALSIGIEAGGTYLYHVEGDAPFTSALVDPEAVQKAGNYGGAFRSRLDKRDGFGIFTGIHPSYCHGQHIIAHSKGDDWLNLIIENRPPYDNEDISGFAGIDDPRNGYLDSSTVHVDASRKRVFIFKTPNCYLRREDIPPAVRRRAIRPGSAPPPNCRFTMMWAVDNPDTMGLDFELPSDANFIEPTADDLPSGLLLDYFNAGIILKRYLKGSEKLDSHPFPRPPEPPVVHQQTYIPRSADRKSLNRPPPPPGTKYQPEQFGDDGQDGDPDEYADAMVLGFWMMSGNARKRREREQREHTERIDSWISTSATVV